jgi:hypothetical protein
MNWCKEMNFTAIDAESILKYITEMHENRTYSAKTLWTINSMIGTYYECFKHVRPHVELPLIAKVLKSWQKREPSKKSEIFEKEAIYKVLKDAPNDAFWLPRKVFLILAICGLLRKNELVPLEMDAVTIVPAKSGQYKKFVKVCFKRLKATGEAEFSYEFFVTDEVMVQCIENYLNCFTEHQKKTGRFFRKLCESKLLNINN